MILRLSDRLVKGSHADVFGPDAGKVYKLFRVGRTERLSLESRAAFVSEATAYEIAHESPLLSNHVPTYFGRCEILGVVDVSGSDVSATYL
jgi:hypothetical protein